MVKAIKKMFLLSLITVNTFFPTQIKASIKRSKSVVNQNKPQLNNKVTQSISGPSDLNKKRYYATYYAKRFHGKRTASGARFDMNSISAAHKSLPLGTWIQVKNLENGKSLITLVNDRVPPKKHSRELDVSAAAAKELGFFRKGSAYVEVTVLHTNSPEVQLVKSLRKKKN